MSDSFKLFPRKRGGNRSCEFNVGCGEAGLISAYNLPCGYSVCINQIHCDYCECEYFEKEYCQVGRQAGVNDESCQSTIAMPGRYVAVLCQQPWADPDSINDDWAVTVNVCPAHQNIQTLLMAAALEK